MHRHIGPHRLTVAQADGLELAIHDGSAGEGGRCTHRGRGSRREGRVSAGAGDGGGGGQHRASVGFGLGALRKCYMLSQIEPGLGVWQFELVIVQSAWRCENYALLAI